MSAWVRNLSIGIAVWLAAPALGAELRLELVDVRKIWDRAPHNAFTDLIRFRDRWHCAFREGSGHIPGVDGIIRVLSSDDGLHWRAVAGIAEDTVDLRDAKLSITPDGRLMMLAGGSIYKPGLTNKPRERISARGRVSFSADGQTWSPTQRISIEDQWLWRLTWHNGVGYGIAYTIVKPMEDRRLALWKTTDGVHYDEVVQPKIPLDTLPNESTIRFAADGTMLALIRNEKAVANKAGAAYLVSAPAPYREWKWQNLGRPAQGPDFLFLPDGTMAYAGRDYQPAKTGRGKAVTVVGHLTRDAAVPLITLPSGGDTSYPGMVWHDNMLWVSYYSTHEGKSSIYLARLRRL